MPPGLYPVYQPITIPISYASPAHPAPPRYPDYEDRDSSDAADEVFLQGRKLYPGIL